MSSKPYNEAIGCLAYAAVCTRLDISFAVGARFSKNPGKAHWAAVKRILSYLAGTTTHGILFSGEGRTNLVGYTDYDNAGDMENRRSTSGYIFLHLGGAISWGSKRQSCTVISTTEAEYVAASNATQEAIWIQRLLSQIGQLPHSLVRILCDNQSAIGLVHNPAHHQRTKHIDVKFHFIREKQSSNFIEIMYILNINSLIFSRSLYRLPNLILSGPESVLFPYSNLYLSLGLSGCAEFQ
jgi:hypothetical protein